MVQYGRFPTCTRIRARGAGHSRLVLALAVALGSQTSEYRDKRIVTAKNELHIVVVGGAFTAYANQIRGLTSFSSSVAHIHIKTVARRVGA